jgi:hypothetical protein
MTARLVISEHDQLGGLGDDDHTQYLLIDGSRAMTGNLEMKHIGVSRPPTATHMIIASEGYATTGAVVGIGCFPEYAPTASSTNTIGSVQGNVWFSTSNWAAGSAVRGLDFYPAPLIAGTAFGSANLDITGVNTGGLLNILGRTVTARYITGIACVPITNIFGGTDDTTVQIVRGAYIPSATTTTGTWGRLCGLEIEPQTSGVINQGMALSGDGIGADLIFGAGFDANIFYDGSNLIIDPDLVGSGRVLIGTTGDDDMLLNDIEIDGALDHDGSTVGFFGTAPAAQAAAYTPSNVSTDRSYDADATTLDEIADVLGTLIADLQSYGLLQ